MKFRPSLGRVEVTGFKTLSQTWLPLSAAVLPYPGGGAVVRESLSSTGAAV